MTSTDRLWFTPEAALERLAFKGRDTEWTQFLFCGLYCVVAVTFLIFYGIAGLLRNDTAYGIVLLSFAVSTCVGYGAIWLSGQYSLARHFVVLLMALLCVFLFHSGGTENSGPMYYFVFPVVALFLQGTFLGAISIAGLLIFTILMYETGLFAFDVERYSLVFISRVFTIYTIVSVLSFLFAFFRARAERELLLSHEDLEHIIHADPLTGFANRAFMERLLAMEYHRCKRYGRHFCLLAMKVDGFEERIHKRYGTEYANSVLAKISQHFLKIMRGEDVASLWDADEFLLMLPESSIGDACIAAERLRREVRSVVFTPGTITVSIGVSENGKSIEETISLAQQNQRRAASKGDCVVAGNMDEQPHKVSQHSIVSHMHW